jgi:hypothetical protein
VVQISHPVSELFQRLTQTGKADVVALPIEKAINTVALATRATGSIGVVLVRIGKFCEPLPTGSNQASIADQRQAGRMKRRRACNDQEQA